MRPDTIQAVLLPALDTVTPSSPERNSWCPRKATTAVLDALNGFMMSPLSSTPALHVLPVQDTTQIHDRILLLLIIWYSGTPFVPCLPGNASVAWVLKRSVPVSRKIRFRRTPGVPKFSTLLRHSLLCITRCLRVCSACLFVESCTCRLAVVDV